MKYYIIYLQTKNLLSLDYLSSCWILCHEYQNCEFCGWKLMKFISFHEIYWNPMKSRCEIYWFLWNQPKFNTAWNLWNSYEIYWNLDYIMKSIWNPMKSRYEIYWFLWILSKFNLDQSLWVLWNLGYIMKIYLKSYEIYVWNLMKSVEVQSRLNLWNLYEIYLNSIYESIDSYEI